MSLGGDGPAWSQRSGTGMVLVVSADEDRAVAMCRALGDTGFVPVVAFDRTQAVHAALTGTTQAAVIDLPDADPDLIAELRRTHPASVLAVADTSPGRAEELFGAGATVLLSPGQPPELVAAQVASVLGLGDDPTDLHVEEVLVHGRLRIDVGARRAWVDDEEVRVTSAQLKVLMVLARAGGAVVSRPELYHLLWGEPDRDGGDRLAALVHRLRRHLPAQGSLLVSVRGEGLRLAD